MHILAELTPLNKTSGARPLLRAASAQDRFLTRSGGQRWWPSMSRKPVISTQLFDGDFSSDVEVGSAAFTIRLSQLENLDGATRAYLWAGGGVTLYALPEGAEVADITPYKLFNGKVSRFSADGDALSLTADVDTAPFEKNVLYLEYAGTTGIEGGADLKGRLKPWILGAAKNVEPVKINQVDNVYQFSAYGPIDAVTALYERGASLGASVGDFATYAALLAATIPSGRWATCLASGLIRLGAPAYGVITGDVNGDKLGGTFVRRSGAIITRVATGAGVSSGLLDATSLAALDTAVPRNINVVITDQMTVLDFARMLAKPCNAQAGISLLGKLYVTRIGIGSPALTLDAQGRRLPGVVRASESEVSPPYKRIMMGANRSWRVHTFDEIASNVNLIDRGQYDPAETYREGNIVSLTDASRWVFVGATPLAGSTPTDANVNWQRMTDAITGIPGADGAPGAPGADGVTTYTWIAYADSIDGQVNFSTGSPGGRAYIGIAANKTTATESTNPADYQWSLYRGPANFGLVNFNGNTIVGPNFVQKVGTGGGWDASAYSSENFRGAASLSFTVPGGYSVMAGLNTDPTTDADWGSLDFAFYVEAGSGTTYIAESGGLIGPVFTNTPGTVFQIVYDGKTVTYSYGNTSFSRVVSVAPNIRFFFDTSLATGAGARIENITWSAGGKAGDDGTDGAPGAPGANGATLYEWNAYADSIDGNVNFTTGAPGGRAFIGRAINKTTSTESSNPADYQWAAYTGPANFGLVNFNGNSIVGPNFIQKVGSVDAWDASAYSSESFRGGAALSFKNATNTHSIMVGLNTDPTTDADYYSLDYALYMRSDGVLEIYESGAFVVRFGGQPAGVTMQIIYDGAFVRYYHGGTFIREVAAAPNLRFWFDTSLATPGSRIENITWAAAGKAGNNGATGDTVRRIWTRSSSAPATPTGNLTPSGWGNDPPAPNGLPLWSSDGRISGADNVTLIGAWSTPVIAEAQAINLAAQTIVINSQNDTFGPIIRALDPSQAISVVARIRVGLTVGPRTQSITVEYRLVNAASWTTLATRSETDASFVAAGVVGTIMNSGGVSETYEIRATTVMSSPNGDVQLERSFFRA
jgi:hypothetical protein